MDSNTQEVFTALSGWVEREHFEREYRGFVTIQEDLSTGESLACFRQSGATSLTTLQYMYLGGKTFVKR